MADKDNIIGPYKLGEQKRGITLDQINSLPPNQRDIFLQNIELINLHSAALTESLNDKKTGSVLVLFNGESISVDDIVRLGQQLPDKEKIRLVTEIMNQNITYTQPELDPFVKRRATAPRQDVADYAQTTRETLTSGIGDCEDWAIAQADLLARMGIPLSHLQIMSGTVYNSNDNTQFDHANLAVKTSTGEWNVMELGQGRVFIAPSNYLDDGLQGYHFVPNISVGADGKISEFKLDNSKSGFVSSPYSQDNHEDRSIRKTFLNATNPQEDLDDRVTTVALHNHHVNLGASKPS